MPTKREREYYSMGFTDAMRMANTDPSRAGAFLESQLPYKSPEVRKPKRKLSAWQKFIKANSKKPRFVLRSGKLNLKKMGVAFRKTPLGKKKR